MIYCKFFMFFFEVQGIEPTVDSLENFLKNHVNEHAFCVYVGLKAYGFGT